MGYDFTGLTLAQQRLLTFQGWECGPDKRGGPRRKTVEPLIARGLLIEHKPEFGRSTVYEVPLSVHMAWCDHCSRQLGPNLD